MTIGTKKKCPVCSSLWEVFFEINMPVCCSIFWPDRKTAQACSRGDIQLAFCPVCGFIGNAIFDPSRLEYSQTYENALDFSPRFQDYANSLANRLVKKYGLYEKAIVEIGCGKGEFLVSLCEIGNNRGTGFDPTYVPLPEHERVKDKVQFVRDLYDDRYANYEADLIGCRHTLEHIADPVSLLKSVRRTVGDRLDTAIFFEVPNALDTFRHLAIWDIIYEHCCYFAPVTLSYLFPACGFCVRDIAEEYQGQFLCLEAFPAEPNTEITDEQQLEVQKLAQNIASFTDTFKRKVATWKDKITHTTDSGKRAVVWGAGAKGVNFLNVLNLQEQVEYIVDINPRKHEMYVAGTGQQVVPPEFLQSYQPDAVIVMNSVYEDEIRRMTRNLGLEVELMCMNPEEELV